jgi:23S rRNA (uridine2552-2'-O)-methyltransferase
MPRAKASGAWLGRHLRDPFVKRSKQDGYRSRAAYKLLELSQTDRLFQPGMTVVDLGAAPGSWSQVALAAVATGGRVIAVDILPIAPLTGLVVVQGDVLKPDTQSCMGAAVGEEGANLVLSDMAPNLCGIASVDQARALELGEIALEFCNQYLKPGGSVVIKGFHGADFAALRRQVAKRCSAVAERKPKASRGESSETYLVGRGWRG